LRCVAAWLAVLVACTGDDAPTEQPDAASEVDVWYDSLVTGEDFSCYVRTVSVEVESSQEVACWGSNASGIFGDGDHDRLAPTPIERELRQLSAGRAHVCGENGDGVITCWGAYPLEADGTGGLALERVSAGDDHTCAVTPDLKAYCWGSNEFGQLGHNSDAVSEAEPVKVEADVLFSRIRAGRHVTCGIEHATGAGYCWGRDDHGQLGDGGPIVAADIARAPVAIALDERLFDIGVGDGMVCATTETEEAYCWGRNDRGQLGSGVDDSSLPLRVPLSGPVQAVAVGGAHVCAYIGSPAAYCWGANDTGQLGMSEPTGFSREPIAVGEGVTWELVAASPSAGGHTCGFAAGNDPRQILCWGRNDHGQLGSGEAGDPQPRPTPILEAP